MNYMEHLAQITLLLGVAAALQILHVPTDDIDQQIQDVRDWDYKPVLETERDN